MTQQQFVQLCEKVGKAVAAAGRDRDTIETILRDDACREAVLHVVFNPDKAVNRDRLGAALSAFDADPTRGRARGALFTGV